jgi:hypothetical protein
VILEGGADTSVINQHTLRYIPEDVRIHTLVVTDVSGRYITSHATDEVRTNSSGTNVKASCAEKRGSDNDGGHNVE